MKSVQSLIGLTVIVFSMNLLLPVAYATETVSQSITLERGWNIVSTPKVLESHTFSVAETSENFDIFALDASNPAGWSTMAGLGQTEFTPLYGYFVNNKTNTEQTLVFNYDTTLEPNEKLFERTFSTTGWYSIGVANDEYAKNQNANRDDANNPSRILSLLEDKYDLVIDFTDTQYGSSRRSVALNDPWKAVLPIDIDLLNDFRETKGYAIYIKEDNASYVGFQNNPANEPVIAELSVETSLNDPDGTTLGLEEDSKTEYTVFAFNLNTGNSTEDTHITRIEITAMGTSDISNYVDDATLLVGGEEVSQDVTVTPTSIVFEFADGDFVIQGGEQVETELSVRFNALTPDHEGDFVQFSLASSNVDAKADDGVILATGSATGDVHTLRTAGINVEAGTISAVVTNGDNPGDDYATFKIELDVTAFEQDVYISTNHVTSIVKAIEDAAGASVAGTSTVVLESTGDEVSGTFEITEGSTETITITVTFDATTAGAAARLNLNTLVFGSTSVAPATQSWTASPDENYRTSVVTIVN